MQENIYEQFVTSIRQNYINNKCDVLKDCLKFMMKLQSWSVNCNVRLRLNCIHCVTFKVRNKLMFYRNV